MENNPIKVSDWSQKYKIGLIIGIFLFFVSPWMIVSLEAFKKIVCNTSYGEKEGSGWWTAEQGATMRWRGSWVDGKCIKLPVYNG